MTFGRSLIPIAVVVFLIFRPDRAVADTMAGTSSSASSAPASIEQAPMGGLRTALGAPLAHAASPFEWGPLSLFPHFDYTYSYGSGIAAAPGTSVHTTVQSIAPGIRAALGSSWSFDYTPTWIFYSNSALGDTVNQAASLTGTLASGDWDATISQSYASTSAALIVTAAQTRQRVWSTDLNVSHSFSDQVSLATSASQTIESAGVPPTGGPSPSLHEWAVSESLRYIFFPHLYGSLGVTGDFTDSSRTTQLYSAQPEATIIWSPDQTVNLTVYAGFETQIFLRPKFPSRNSPVWGTASRYSPFPHTTVSLSFDHSSGVSYLTNQVTTSTTWSASLQQRLLGAFSFTAGVAGSRINYVDSTIAPNRTDHYHSYDFGITTPTILRHGTVSLSYNTGHNTSSLGGYSISSHDLQLDVGIRY